MVDLGEPIGHEQGFRRPAVVLSVDRFNRTAAGVVLVVPVTSTRRGIPLHVEIEPGGSGLDRVSYAKIEDLRSVSTLRLARRLGSVPPDVLYRIGRVAGALLGLSTPRP